MRHRRRRSVTDVDEFWTHRHRKKDVRRLHILVTITAAKRPDQTTGSEFGIAPLYFV